MLTIVWDVDDVLNDLMYQWFHEGWKVERPDCALDYSGLIANPPHEHLGVEKADYLQSLDAFRRSERALAMQPNPKVLAWFREHGARFRHIALTARPLETAPDVAHWVMKHFGAWIRCFGVVPTREIPGVPRYDTGKGEYLSWLGKGDVLVDDTPENLRHAEAVGVRGLAYPQPWNSAPYTVEELLNQLAEMGDNS